MSNSVSPSAAPPQTPRKPTPLEHTLASQGGGAISTIICYPIDVVKMRFMSQDGTVQRQHNGQTYRRMFSSLWTIRKEEGVGALFRGCHAAVIGTVAAWGVYMYAYRTLSRAAESMRDRDDAKPGPQLSFWECCALSIVSSCASAVACNPIWLLKTRMQLEETSVRTANQVKHYSGLLSGGCHVVRTTGVRSLWTGVSAQIALGVPNAFNLPIYDSIKALRLWQTNRSTLSPVDVCLCSTLTKVSLAVVCHPLHVLKTRLQDQRSHSGEVTYNSLHQSVRQIVQRNGVVGLYRGMVPSLMQTVPRSVLMFLFYEQLLNGIAMAKV